MNKIDEIRARHGEHERGLKNATIGPPMLGSTAHQDRAYLLERIAELEFLLDWIAELPRYKVNSVGVGPDIGLVRGTVISARQHSKGKWVSAGELEAILKQREQT